jgi:FMN phosphatase YigB (HAD superfamily)
MPLRLGFDLDGVLADLNAALRREAVRLFPGVDIRDSADRAAAPGAAEADGADGADPTETAPSSLNLTRRQERQLWDAVRRIDNFWETLDETEPGIIRRLGETARAQRWEVMFLTSRPRTAGDVVQLQSQRWLRSRGFEFPSLFVVSTSRGRIASSLELDVVVDDRPENCLDIAIDSKARAILVWRGDQNAVPASARRLGIGGVTSVGACLDLLVKADRPDEEPTSIVDRLKGLLGLKRSTTGAA